MFKKVENKGRYKTAQGYYWHIHDDGIDYLFTNSALQEAEKRAKKNPEDIPHPVEENSSATIGFACGLILGVLLTVATYFVVNIFKGF